MNEFKCSIQGEIRDTPSETSKEDLAQINRFTLKPLAAEDVSVFRMDLCNDQIDRHHSRFPHEELETINRMIVGKPLMQMHQTHTRQPDGVFFQSRVNKEGSTRAHGGDAWSVQPDSYILKQGNEDLIRNIEGGVYRGTSIGFSFMKPECSICETDLRECAHWPGEIYDEKTCHYIIHDVNDVFEGSIVSLGSQGTEFVQARALDALDYLPLMGVGNTWAEKNSALAYARSHKGMIEIDSSYSQDQRVDAVKFLNTIFPNSQPPETIGLDLAIDELRSAKLTPQEETFKIQNDAKELGKTFSKISKGIHESIDEAVSTVGRTAPNE